VSGGDTHSQLALACIDDSHLSHQQGMTNYTKQVN